MKKMLLILTFTLFCLNSYAITRKRTPVVPVHSSRSMRQQVDSYTSLLQKEVAEGKNIKEKYKILERVIGQLRTLRSSNVDVNAQEESYIDLVLSVLESMPSSKRFKKAECGRYQTDFLNQFEPSADDVPQEPAVVPGWSVLKALCS